MKVLVTGATGFLGSRAARLFEENGHEVVRGRKVALGGVYNNQVEVLPAGSEVKAGSKVIVTTAERLTDGIAIRTIQDNSAPAAEALSEAK